MIWLHTECHPRTHFALMKIIMFILPTNLAHSIEETLYLPPALHTHCAQYCTDIVLTPNIADTLY